MIYNNTQPSSPLAAPPIGISSPSGGVIPSMSQVTLTVDDRSNCRVESYSSGNTAREINWPSKTVSLPREITGGSTTAQSAGPNKTFFAELQSIYSGPWNRQMKSQLEDARYDFFESHDKNTRDPDDRIPISLTLSLNNSNNNLIGRNITLYATQ